MLLAVTGAIGESRSSVYCTNEAVLDMPLLLALTRFGPLLDERREQPDSRAGAAARVAEAGGAGDVEVHPGDLADEALEKKSCRDRAAVAPADVLHVGDRA